MEVILFLLGVVCGFVANWFFASRGSKELREEAAKLRNLVKIIIDALENNGMAKITRDQNGEPVSLTLQIRVGETISTTKLFTPEVKIVDDA
jgi:hypothetical protein